MKAARSFRESSSPTAPSNSTFAAKTSRSRVSLASRSTVSMPAPTMRFISVHSTSEPPTPGSRSHAVQYHSLPTYTWQKLRTDHPAKYEQAVNPVPDPNAWFHARVLVANAKVSLFVADAKEPCLVVDALNDRKTGLVGL